MTSPLADAGKAAECAPSCSLSTKLASHLQLFASTSLTLQADSYVNSVVSVGVFPL